MAERNAETIRAEVYDATESGDLHRLVQLLHDFPDKIEPYQSGDRIASATSLAYCTLLNDVRRIAVRNRRLDVICAVDDLTKSWSFWMWGVSFLVVATQDPAFVAAYLALFPHAVHHYDEMESLVQYAARHPSTDVVTTLLDAGAEPGIRIRTYTPILEVAVEAGHPLSLFEKLIDAGANVNDYLTILTVSEAVERRRADVLRLMLDRGMDPRHVAKSRHIDRMRRDPAFAEVVERVNRKLKDMKLTADGAENWKLRLARWLPGGRRRDRDGSDWARELHELHDKRRWAHRQNP